MKTRDCALDFIAGFLLLYIIYSHCCSISKTENMLHSPLLAFYMPWFFFKGGMFFKGCKSNNIIQIGGGKRLVLPFVKYSLLGFSIDFIFCLIFNNQSITAFLLSQIKTILLQNSVFGNLPLWFLLSLFCSRIICHYLIRYKFNSCLIAVGLIAFSVLLNVIRTELIGYIPYLLCTAVTGSFFYWVGYKLRDFQYVRSSFILSIAIVSIFFWLGFPQVDMRSNLSLNGSYLLWFPYSIAGIVCLNNLVKLLPDSFITYRFNILTRIGSNSMTFYVWHWIFLLPVYHILKTGFHISNNVLLLVALICVSMGFFFVRHKRI